MSCSKFQCPTCLSKNFDSRAEVILHAIEDHGLISQWCGFCEESFEDLEGHEREVHDGKPLKCPFCVHFTSNSNCLKSHIDKKHHGMLGSHNAADDFELDRNALPPTGKELKKMMDELGYPQEIKTDETSPHFIIGVNEKEWPVFSFNVLTPRIANRTNRSLKSFPGWWWALTTPAGHDKSHVVPLSDLNHVTDPGTMTTTKTNWVATVPHFNRHLWSILEMYRQYMGSVWSNVPIFTALEFRENEKDRIPTKMGSAFILRREGETPIIACFVIPHSAKETILWPFMTSLKKFHEEFKMPDLFSKVQNFRELCDLRPEKVIPCKIKACRNRYLDETIANTHSSNHMKRESKAILRTESAHVKTVCFKCLGHFVSTYGYHRHMLTQHTKSVEKTPKFMDVGTQWEPQEMTSSKRMKLGFATTEQETQTDDA